MSEAQLPPGYRKTALDMVEGHDLTGKTVIVTGGTSGIGIETVRAFAKAGAHVINAARNAERAAAVNDEIKKSTGNDRVEFMELNLSSLKKVAEFTKAFLDKKLPLHILVCNAGVMAPPERSETEDGLEIMFGVNHMANFVLLTRLLPALQSGSKEGCLSRVVVVSSCAHLYCDVNFDDVNYTKDYDKRLAYGSSKTAAVYLAFEFHRRYGKEVTANALHPGGIMTGLQKNMSIEEKKSLGWIDDSGNINPLFKTVEQGAATSVYCALSKDLEGVGAQYFEDCAKSIPSPKFPIGYAEWVHNEENASRLWKLSEEICASKL